MNALTNIATLLKYAPQIMSLFTTVQTIYATLPSGATLESKVAAVETVIQAIHDVAVADGVSTVTFDEFYNPLKAMVAALVAILHTSTTTA